MKIKDYYKIRKVIIPLVAVLVFAAIYFGHPFLILLFLFLGKIIISFLKTQVKENLEDERVESIHQRAARTSFKVLMPILGFTSLALFYAGDGPFYFLRSLGIILGYVTCVGLIVYLISFYYFERKYGG